MQTGLEKIRNKIMEDTTCWRQIDCIYEDYGDCKTIWYCDHQDLTCYMYYEKDMDGELYLTKIEFYNEKQFE